MDRKRLVTLLSAILALAAFAAGAAMQGAGLLIPERSNLTRRRLIGVTRQDAGKKSPKIDFHIRTASPSLP